MEAPMRIAYVIEEPQLCGGVKVVFQHARLLVAAGHSVTVFGRGAYPDWAFFGGLYIDYARGALTDYAGGGGYDLIIATYYPTIERALAADIGPVVHFCQGYEGFLEHLHPHLKEIERAYCNPLPAFVVSPHLGEFLERRFGRPSMLVPPPKDLRFLPSMKRSRRSFPVLVVPGIFEAPCKGVREALEAVVLLKNRYPGLRLVRLSTLKASDAENSILRAEHYLCGVSPDVVAQELRHADLMIFPSKQAEGFGLPLLESMCSKLPAVASRIPSVEFMTRGAVPLVVAGDSEGYAWAAERLLEHTPGWLDVRKRGFEESRRFHPRLVAARLEQAVTWAADACKVVN